MRESYNSPTHNHCHSNNKMATKASNFSDLIQRVTANCLLHPLGSGRHNHNASVLSSDDDDDNYQSQDEEKLTDERDHFEDVDDDADSLKKWEGDNSNKGGKCELRTERVAQMEMLMGEVFEAVSAMKKAYVGLQEAHSPWDQDKMRVADLAVVSELRRLGVLRERYRRSIDGGNGGRGGWRVGAATLREVVAPYEAAVEELKKEVKAKEVEIDNLREKFRTASSLSGSGSGSGGKKGSRSKRRVSCSTQGQLLNYKKHLPFLTYFS